MVGDVNQGLRVCVLSGGSSRRMGRDKALLPHPSGGVWLTALVDQLLPLGYPVQVLSRHAAHAELLTHRPGCSVVLEPPPWNGPLKALARLLPSRPGEALLVLPVDMPRLRTAVVQQLIAAWNRAPDQAAVAHDGQRLQPLLAVIPSGSPFRSCLDQQLQCGELRWMDWLTCVPHQTVLLPAEALLNANCPADLAALEG
ncbi:molybdenum cofactor guanylyltransferase [Synechococcus sp. A15-44]|uniref:molybdenum cofactor guanylyltransferase n=1 Tax=Synechococcus sp. A15-44 TaxID=1050646 RepID=UPI002104B88C|nr:molybdenum cofactor guanylyltransferase [Synechococcus sp. A15-44]